MPLRLGQEVQGLSRTAGLIDAATEACTLQRGSAPLLVSIPHLGLALPADCAAGMTEVAGLQRDADWHLDRLYDFARELGASVLAARVSRYVVDLNRPPGGESLYPGQTTTGLFPTETFRGEPLYLPGHEPDEAERARRLHRYWQPYHDALAAELARLRAAHGAVLLWEAHSIAGELPRLFDGELPALNFGTNDGRSCADEVRAAALAPAAGSAFSQVLNGRFKGGYITRRYGDPAAGVHAIQLEMAQRVYMDEAPPFAWRPDRAQRVQPLLRAMLEAGAAAARRAGAGPVAR
jgi:N-formylglutamate deformylase